MSKLKIIIIFIIVLTIPSYFILKKKNLTLEGVKKSFQFKDVFDRKVEESVDADFIKISESELNGLLKPYAKTIENFKVDIKTTGIYAAGETTLPTKSTLEIIIVPEVKNDKVSYRIEKMMLGKVKAPSFLADKVISGANKELDRRINDKMKVERIEIDEENIFIYRKKG